MDAELQCAITVSERKEQQKNFFDNVTLVFKVMGKMYACIGFDNLEWLSLNVT